MLPKNYQLKKRSAFTATYKTGKIIREQGLTLFVGKEKENDVPTRVGFVVSKKVHKRAVKRNRMKRLLRESYRLMIKNNKVSTKYMSLIFVGSNRLLNSNFNEIDMIMKKILKKIL